MKLEISINQASFRRLAILGTSACVLLGGYAAVHAAPVTTDTFATGETLTGAKLTINFGKLRDAINANVIPPGTVIAYAGATVPAGWLLCDGRPVSRTTYKDLFAAVLVAHGGGNGTDTFNLPDYRGLFLRGVDNGAKRDEDAAARVEPKKLDAAVTGGKGNAGDLVGSVQGDSFRSHDHGGGDHTHTFATSPCGHTDYAYTHLALNGNGTYSGNCGDDNSYVRGSGRTVAVEGGKETRPANASVQYLIRF